jgi:cobalt transporter subunit CbtA
MTIRMVAGGVIAGFAAGLLAALLHFAFIQNTLLLGEQYESGAAVHWAGPLTPVAAQDPGDPVVAEDAAEATAEAMPEATTEEDSAFTRNALTVLFTGFIYSGYGLILVAAMQVPSLFGRTVNPRDGLLWGVAGYAVFQALPSLGLPPQLPGTLSADVVQRQIWWIATIVASAIGLGLLAYGRNLLWALVAIALLVAPHLIGAPEIEGYWGYAPPELGAVFATRVLGVGLVAWAFLGWLVMRVAPPQDVG